MSTLPQVIGVIGAGHGQISAAGRITARFGQAASIQSSEWLELQNDAVDCQLQGREIRVGGRVIGGVAKGAERIVVRQAGAASGGGTILIAAEPLELPVEVALAIIAGLKARRHAVRRGGRGPGWNRKRGKGGKRSRAEMALQREAISRKRDRAQAHKYLLNDAIIDVHGTAHPGVLVRFGKQQMLLARPVHGTRFRPGLATPNIRTEKIKG